MAVKVTIAFSDDRLYQAVRVRAVQSGRQIRDIVQEALEDWLQDQEDAEDLSASVEALTEYDEAGGSKPIATPAPGRGRSRLTATDTRRAGPHHQGRAAR